MLYFRNINKLEGATSNGVSEELKKYYNSQSVKQVLFQINHLRIRLVSRPFNLFENTIGTIACQQQTHFRSSHFPP